MFKTAGRLINFRTLFLVALYIFFKSDKRNITTYEIKEESMSPALLPDDYVLAIKNKEPLSRGDIVIFKNHEKNIDVVKRIIGLPGETVGSENGRVLINDIEIDDIWAKTLTDDFIPQTLGDEEVFVLGDQRRLSSSDSRTLGPIPIQECWKLKYRYWPYQRFKAYE
tara:strand:+ start:355 stop:855 length:501 start_codon:yes stop_codon:yes gene_type:complete